MRKTLQSDPTLALPPAPPSHGLGHYQTSPHPSPPAWTSVFLAFSKLSGDYLFSLALLIPHSGLFWSRPERFMLRAVHWQYLAGFGPALCPLPGRPPARRGAGAHKPHSQVSADFCAPHFRHGEPDHYRNSTVRESNYSMPL